MRHSMLYAASRMWPLVLYGLIGAPLILVIDMALQLYNTYNDPLQNWFQPIHLHVPSHCAGDDPEVTYDRQIKKEFENSFHAQYVDVLINNDLGFPICAYQSGVFEYYAKNNIRVRPKLSEFMGRACNLPAGRFRAEITWHPIRRGYVDETVSLVSNVFEVYASTNDKCKGVVQ